MNLNERACLITGGTKGIGAATALALAEQGANLALAARNIDDEARALGKRIEALGRRCFLIAADLGRPEEAVRCVEQTAAEFGSVDVLVHSAGGPVPGGLLEVTPEEWMRAFDVHVHAVYHLCRSAVPLMQKKREGAIVLVSSSAGRRGCPGITAYQVVKGALPQFARALARDFAADNIRVNVVAPGVIRTRFHDKMTEATRKNNLENRIPLRREGTSEQVATLIRELVTNDYITGETFGIDGGLTMRIA
ncbi:MAG TPA: SDR family NAD(P)-dependent oxidoreductase [Pirellulales bacterium]|jgi:NAD(P)-dependent dehydrogenase (short-subunit alcohol dehydrogenase family)|nr:SDR family NAD(P)-dependent oxidoreductase [Pirellulales bacterium]